MNFWKLEPTAFNLTLESVDMIVYDNFIQIQIQSGDSKNYKTYTSYSAEKSPQHRKHLLRNTTVLVHFTIISPKFFDRMTECHLTEKSFNRIGIQPNAV
jgi:hypothetical protein